MKSIGKSGCCTNHLGAGWRSGNTCQYMLSCMILHISQYISFFFCNSIDPVCTSAKCDFSQCRQFFSAEKILKRPFRLDWSIYFSLFHSIDQLFRLNINHFYLICLIKHTVRNSFSDFNIRNISHQIIQTFQMLDIHRCIYIDTSSKKLLYILISLFISTSMYVCMRQLIHQE